MKNSLEIKLIKTNIKILDTLRIYVSVQFFNFLNFGVYF